MEVDDSLVNSHGRTKAELSSFENTYGYDSDSNDPVEESDDDELSCCSSRASKLQQRYVSSKARWDEELGMAEVLEMKGKWNSTGIVRGGKILCSLEETLYLAEIGALVVYDANDTRLELFDIYGKLAEDKNRFGCSWEAYQVYRNLKSLGYVVGRHGIPWSLKSSKIVSDDPERITEPESTGDGAVVNISEMLSSLQLSETRPIFDVYPPNDKFRKTCPGTPSFVLFLVSGKPPSNREIKNIESRYKGSPLKFCYVEHGRVTTLSFTKTELPLLP